MKFASGVAMRNVCLEDVPIAKLQFLIDVAFLYCTGPDVVG